MKFIFKFLFITGLVFEQGLFSQSNVNPNISAIGSFDIFTNFIEGSDEYRKLNFKTPGLELFIDGYLNPFARASANTAFEEGEFELEELYAEILRGLPLDIQIKAGKYLVGFGKINTLHPHAWPFLNRPLVHQIYFGEEGFNDIGFDVSFILPAGDVYSSLDIGLYKGDAVGKTQVNNPEDDESIFNLRGINPVMVSRLAMFFNLNDYNNLEIGLNGSYGLHSKSQLNFTGDSTAAVREENLYFLYGGLDFKYKFKSDSYTSLTIQGEGLLNHRDVIRNSEMGINTEKEAVKKITTFGGFIYFDYQFLKQFCVGGKYDFTYGILGDKPSMFSLTNDDANSTSGISGWIGFYPVEETLALRLGLEYLTFNYQDGTKRDEETVIQLQMLFSLGPHKAHQF